MTRIIKLPSVGCAFDIDNLLTHPITSEGEVLEDSLPLQDCTPSWFICLSIQDKQIIDLAIEAFEAKKLLKKVTGVTEVSNFTRDMRVNEEIKNFLSEAREVETNCAKQVKKDSIRKQWSSFFATDNERFSSHFAQDGYSQYNNRWKQSVIDKNLEYSEIYGLEQAEDHIKELYLKEDEYSEGRRSKPMHIFKETTIREHIKTITYLDVLELKGEEVSHGV